MAEIRLHQHRLSYFSAKNANYLAKFKMNFLYFCSYKTLSLHFIDVNYSHVSMKSSNSKSSLWSRLLGVRWWGSTSVRVLWGVMNFLPEMQK